MSNLSNFFRDHGTPMRIAMGQVSVVVTLLLVAAFVGIVPDRKAAVIDGRVALAEVIASNSSIFITQSDLRRMQANLQLILSRNPDILSAMIRREDGSSLVETGQHEALWLLDGDPNSQLVVPIWEGERRWGQVELRFEPLAETGLRGFFLEPVTLLILFIAASSFLFFFFYLRRMLKDLDPSQAIPERVRSALDTMAEGLLVLDARQNIVLANEAFSELVGVTPGKLLGQRVGTFNWSNADDTPMARADYPWTQALSECTSQRNQPVKLRIGSEEARTFQTNCSPVLTAEDKAGGVLISFDDITALEEKEQQLRMSKLEAEQANQAKSDFLANMSHEIRTPMTAIMGFTEVLKRAYKSSGGDVAQGDSVHYLNTIANSSQHLLDLINDILDLSKVEAGRVEVEELPCAVQEIVHGVLQIMQAKAQEKGLTLVYRPSGPLPATIQSDSARLRQILINLVGNAIKFTEQGEVTISTALVESAGGNTVSISVADTGIGMTREQQAGVFQAFVQADSSITRRFGGTGLGLTICKRFAEALGGDVTVRSEEGHGSEFTVTVPTGDLAGVAMLQAEELLAAASEPTEDEQAGRWIFDAARVLVVDDGAENRELLALVLRDHGLSVTLATNGAEALAALAEEAFELIVMDCQMPVMDGYSAVARMREQGIVLPVIALTADAMKGAEQRCLDAGYSDYLTKPINFERLLTRLAKDLKAQFMVESDRSAPAPVAAAEGAANGAPIYSRLPTAQPRYEAIVLRFVTRLDAQVSAMEQALKEERYDALQDLGHWLKGSGGSVGFHEFDEPGGQVEIQARRRDRERLGPLVKEIRSLTARVAAAYPTAAPGVEPVNISTAAMPGATQAPMSMTESSKEHSKELDALPGVVISTMQNNARFQPLVERFVRRLREQLTILDRAADAGRLDEVADLAHWLKGSAGTVGFHDFTEPAEALEAAAKAGQTLAVSDQVALIRTLCSRIPPEQDAKVAE